MNVASPPTVKVPVPARKTKPVVLVSDASLAEIEPRIVRSLADCRLTLLLAEICEPTPAVNVPALEVAVTLLVALIVPSTTMSETAVKVELLLVVKLPAAAIVTAPDAAVDEMVALSASTEPPRVIPEVAEVVLKVLAADEDPVKVVSVPLVPCRNTLLPLAVMLVIDVVKRSAVLVPILPLSERTLRLLAVSAPVISAEVVSVANDLKLIEPVAVALTSPARLS